jgi:hypothetical protein
MATMIYSHSSGFTGNFVLLCILHHGGNAGRCNYNTYTLNLRYCPFLYPSSLVGKTIIYTLNLVDLLVILPYFVSFIMEEMMVGATKICSQPGGPTRYIALLCIFPTWRK